MRILSQTLYIMILSIIFFIKILQDTLLINLGVNTSEGDSWPLTVYPRTLAVLAEVILLRQQREREAKQLVSQTESNIIMIWTRFMNTLTNNVLSSSSKTDPNDGNFFAYYVSAIITFFLSGPKWVTPFISLTYNVLLFIYKQALWLL